MKGPDAYGSAMLSPTNTTRTSGRRGLAASMTTTIALIASLIVSLAPSPDVAEAAASELRVASFNISSGNNFGRDVASIRARTTKIAQLLAAQNPDVVVLQEVARGRSSQASQRYDELVEQALEAQTGQQWNRRFFSDCTFRSGGGQEGLSILSTASIGNPRTLMLNANDSSLGGPCENYNKCPGLLKYPSLPPRTTFAASVQTHGVQVVNVHMSSSCGSSFHAAEFASLKRQIGGSTPTQTIVAGDFNTTSTKAAGYLPGWVDHTTMITSTSFTGTDIDHIMSTSDLARRAGTECASGTVGKQEPAESDHRAIASTIAFSGERYTPFRLLDTRCDQRSSAQTWRCETVTALGGIPTGATAVNIAASVVNPSGNGYVIARGSGEAVTTSHSMMNYRSGTTTSNTATVRVRNGKICLWAYTATDFVVDVTGFYDTASEYTPTAPERVIDAQVAARVSGSSRWSCHVVAGANELTPASARAVAVNITVVVPSRAGWLRVVGAGDTAGDLTSNLNYAQGETTANSAHVKVGTGGKICISSSQAVRVLVDLVGHFPSSSSYRPVTLDRRTINGRARTWDCFTVAGTGGIPDDAKSVTISLAVRTPPSSGWLKTVGRSQVNSGISTTSYRANQTKATGQVVKIGTLGRICIWSTSASTIYVDVFGYSTRASSL